MRRAAFFDVLFGAFWLAALGFALWFWGGATPLGEASATTLVCAAAAVWLVGRGGLGLSWRETWPWLAWLILAVVSLAWAPSLEEGLAYVTLLLAGLVSFAAGATFSRRLGGAQYLFWMLAAVGVAAAGYGFAQLAGLADASFWLNKAHMASRFVNGSHFGAFAAAVAIPTASAALVGRRRGGRVLLIAAVAVLTVALALSRSRAAWIGMGAGLLAWSLGVAASERKMRRAVLLTILVCVLAGALAWPFVSSRVAELESTDFWSMRQRLDIWRGCMAMLRAVPMGVGAGSFEVAFPAYKVSSDRFFVNFAHNEPLQVACELGPLGLLILGWLAWLVLSAWRSAVRRGGSAGVLASGAGGALVALSVQSLVDFPFHLPALALVGALLAGVVVGLGRDGVGARLRWVLALLVLLGAVCSGLMARGLDRLEAAKRLEESMRYGDALVAYEAAAAAAPLLSGAWEGQGRIHVLRATLGGSEREAEAALSAYGEALRRRRGEALYLLNVAWMQMRLGDEAAGEKSLREARALAPQDGDIAFELARHLVRRERCDEGLAELSAAMRLFRREGRHGETARVFDLVLAQCCGPEALVELFEGNGPALVELGDYLFRHGMMEEAAWAYEAALVAERRDPRAQERLGRVKDDLR